MHHEQNSFNAHCADVRLKTMGKIECIEKEEEMGIKQTNKGETGIMLTETRVLYFFRLIEVLPFHFMVLS